MEGRKGEGSGNDRTKCLRVFCLFLIFNIIIIASTCYYVFTASKGNVSGQSLFRNNNGQNAFMGCASFSTFGQSGQKASTGDRVYAGFNLYKGKAALEAKPVAPTFSENEAGALFVKRPGNIMLSFTPSKGDRKYDWERRQRFALSPTEVGALISMAPNGSCDFFHDPGLKSSNAGQVRKSLKISPTADGNGHFFSLSVFDSAKKINERFSVQVTPGEFSVLRTAFSYAHYGLGPIL